MRRHSLLTAASVLDTIASGHIPDRTDVVCGAIALDTLCRVVNRSVDLLDARAILNAARGLAVMATGGALELDAEGRRLAAELAATVREFAQVKLKVVEAT